MLNNVTVQCVFNGNSNYDLRVLSPSLNTKGTISIVNLKSTLILF